MYGQGYALTLNLATWQNTLLPKSSVRAGPEPQSLGQNPVLDLPKFASSKEWISRFRNWGQSIPNQNYIPASAADPFSATPIPLTRSVETLIRYHIVMSATGSHNDKAEVLPPHLQSVRRYHEVREALFARFMQVKVDLAGLLVVMSARMFYISRIPFIGNASPETYTQIALAAVREQMQDCQTKDSPRSVLVRGMHALALAACISQQFGAAATHIRAAKSLIHFLDPTDPLDAFIGEGLFNIDRMISTETGWIPQFDLLFDPGPLDHSRLSFIKHELADYASGRRQPTASSHSPAPDSCSPSDSLMPQYVDFLADASTTLHHSLGRGLEQALQADLIHPDLASIFRDTLDCLTVAKYVWRTSDATRSDADWMCKRMRAISHRLLLLPASLSYCDDTMKTEALRLALFLVVVRCTNRMSYRTAQPNMRRLQEALSGIDTNWAPTSSPEVPRYEVFETVRTSRSSTTSSPSSPSPKSSALLENSLLLWVLMTGLFAAQGEPEESWFLVRAAFVAEFHMGLKSYEDLQDFMMDYLYSSTQQQYSLIAVSLHLSS
ncbi:hypothetical protein B0A52_09038 [Exophiala mesophila]|uniref:Transcription factor domain-containing protein n=1 Tax=Exophiala mesophila TaxID=212818 RepID=A0A438MUW7_EXOME|nr:hypothetical protein B0A52_09038 [Exophiala mesophila]